MCCEEIEITNQTGESYRINQQVVLDGITNLLKCELSQSLVGIYLHGSMAMGYFTPQQSNIDILVIVLENDPMICTRLLLGK